MSDSIKLQADIIQLRSAVYGLHFDRDSFVKNHNMQIVQEAVDALINAVITIDKRLRVLESQKTPRRKKS